MAAKSTVSIGMPVFNGETHLRAGIESLLGQSYSDIELIISDNASTDATEEICRDYARRDTRVRYYRNDVNVGASANYNAVFRHARGTYFKWASSNDICGREFIEKCVDVLERRPDVVLVYPRTRLIYSGAKPPEDYVDAVSLPQESACDRFSVFLDRIRLNNVMNGVVRTAVLGRTPLIEIFFSSDISLMAEVALYGKFVELPEFLFYRRMDPESATAKKSAQEILRHYDPKLRRRMLFQTWKLNHAYLSGVWRAPLPLSEKMCLYRHMAKRIIWDREKLARELWHATSALFQSKA
jgi:glycosyltransferase involved in cell wall biosynthesis